MAVVRAAIIINGVVDNVTKAKPEFAIEQGWVVSDTAKIGDLYDGSTFTTPAADTAPTAKEVRLQGIHLAAKATINGKGIKNLDLAELREVVELLALKAGIID